LIRLEIAGDSMLPSLRPGERVLVVRGLAVHAGVLVAVRDPRDPARMLVKRVEGMIGEDVYLAGDNPDASTDSREFGAVARSGIEGRVVYRYWPAERAGSLLR